MQSSVNLYYITNKTAFMKKILIMLYLCSMSASAGLWPMITSLAVENVYLDQGIWHAEYRITQKLLEIGPAADVKNFCGQYVVLGHRHNPESTDIVAQEQVSYIQSNECDLTASQSAIYLYNTFGSKNSVVYHNGDKPTESSECVAYVITKEINGPWSEAYVPGGCLIIPPVDEWCKITTPSIVFDHGTLQIKNVEGDTVSQQVKLQCTTPTAVTFNLITSDNYIYLDDGKSEITVDNKPLNTKIDLPAGDDELTIKDSLTGVTKEGYHTGSSVLVMMPY